FQADVLWTQVQCFLDTCAGVVKKRQQGMIPLSFQSGSIGLGQDCGDFRGFQIADSLPRRPLEWDAPHLGALLSGKRLVCRNEREEAAQCRQPAVPSTDGRLAFLLDILEKGEYRRSAEMFQPKRSHRPLLMFGCEPEE